MDSLNIQLAVLSLPAGFAESFEEAKRDNALMHQIVLQHEGRFAFWGCLGDWRDVEGKSLLKLTRSVFQRRCFIGALQLIPYVFDELGAVGIAVSSSYGSGDETSGFTITISLPRTRIHAHQEPGYIGDDIYDRIWSALDARGAIIFIHGTQTPSSTPIPHPTLGLPITEVSQLPCRVASFKNQQLTKKTHTRRYPTRHSKPPPSSS
jgi:hypothetical protein